MRRAVYEDDVIKLLDKGWKSGVYPVASNIHALPPAQPGIDCQELLKAVYKHPLLGGYEKAVITGIVRELQEDESEVDE